MKYPTDRKGRHWSHRVVRLMLKTCACQEIGTTGVTLVTFVAHTEDAKQYTGPVSFYNDQLLPLLGISKWDTLAAARKKAVDAGWLHYHNPQPTGRSPGYYWSLVPDDLDAVLDDQPTDEGWSPEHVYRRGYDDGFREGRQSVLSPILYPKNGESRGDSHGESRGDSHGESRGDSHGEPSTLSLTLSLSQERDAAPTTSGPKNSQGKQPPPLLVYLIERWNSLEFSQVKTSPIGKTNLTLWNRTQSDPDLGQYFASEEAIDALIEAVRTAKWAHSQKTFGFNWLFELNFQKSAYKAGWFLSGAYVGTNGKHDVSKARAQGATYVPGTDQDEGF